MYKNQRLQSFLQKCFVTKGENAKKKNHPKTKTKKIKQTTCPNKFNLTV